MEIKVTLQYSNPQIIRELALPKDFTARQLYQAICISTEWDTRRDGTFYRNGKVLEDSAKITENLFEEDTTLACVVGNVEQPDWCFRIEQVESPDPTLQPKWPVLIRHRGGAILNKIKSVVEMNRYQNGWYGSSDEIVVNDINTKLELTFDKGRINQVKGPDFSKCKSCTRQLVQLRVDDLKEIEQKLDINILPRTLKNERVERIAKNMALPDTIKRVLEQMSLIEYRTFLRLYNAGKAVAVSNENEFYQYHTLSTYGLIEGIVGDEIHMSLELAKGAAFLMEESVADELMKFHEAKAVVDVGVQLYNFINKQLYNKLLDSCYPGEFTEKQRESCWKKLIQMSQNRKMKARWVSLEDSFLGEDVSLERVVLVNRFGYENYPFYIPNYELVETMELYRVSLTRQQMSILWDTIRKRTQCPEIIIEQLGYVLIRKCMDSEIRYAIQVFYRYGVKGSRAAMMKQMEKVLQMLLEQVRRPQYFGHTKEEYEVLTGGKQK